MVRSALTLQKNLSSLCFESERGAHFLGRLIYESGTFRYVEENLNYSKSPYSQYLVNTLKQKAMPKLCSS